MRLAPLAITALLALSAVPAAHAETEVAGIHLGTCSASPTGVNDDTLRVCTYVPLATAGTLGINGSGSGKQAWVDCLSGYSSPHISSGVIRVTQTPGDYCTLHVTVVSGPATGSIDARQIL